MIWVKAKRETLASNNKRKHESDSDDEDNNEEERQIAEEITESVDEEYEGEVAVSQILFLAVRGFNVSDCLGFSKSQIPGNTCQIECSRPKSCPVPLARMPLQHR
jgi:Fe-S-cluster containining protein